MRIKSFPRANVQTESGVIRKANGSQLEKGPLQIDASIKGQTIAVDPPPMGVFIIRFQIPTGNRSQQSSGPSDNLPSHRFCSRLRRRSRTRWRSATPPRRQEAVAYGGRDRLRGVARRLLALAFEPVVCRAESCVPFCGPLLAAWSIDRYAAVTSRPRDLPLTCLSEGVRLFQVTATRRRAAPSSTAAMPPRRRASSTTRNTWPCLR